MKYEGQQYGGEPDAPAWFKGFLYHYAGVIRFLTQFNTSKFTMGTDVNLGAANKVKLVHGVETKIAHGMKTTPSRVLVTGRVLAVNVKSISATDVYLTAKLLSTGVRSITGETGYNSLIADDLALFRVGDGVTIASKPYIITRIKDNKVAFDREVNRGTVSLMILTQEEATLTVF